MPGESGRLRTNLGGLPIHAREEKRILLYSLTFKFAIAGAAKTARKSIMESENGSEIAGEKGAGLSLRLDAEKKALLATVTPTEASAPIDEAWLLEQIQAQGFGDLRYLPQAATVLLGRYNAGDAVADFAVAQAVDAQFKLRMSGDAMEVALDITPAQGGAALTRHQVLQALAEKGVKKGLLPESLHEALEWAETTTEKTVAQSFVIARGQPPEAGKDSVFERLIPEIRDRRPKISARGLVDYREMGEIPAVRPGDALVLRHPPTAGVPGYTVTGVEVAARPGQEIAFADKLSGVERHVDNPDLLVAGITGQPVMVERGAQVEPLITLPAVNMASGNVEFEGSVFIKGDVAAGMTVKAGGDIEIGGMAENATLEAGGSILVKGGILGAADQEGGSPRVTRAAQNVQAAYAQKARIEAGENILIADMAMQCELLAGQHIKLGHGKKGHLIGGRAQAMLSVSARVLGSPNRIRTLCQIGVDPTLAKQAKELAAERSGHEDQLLEYSKLLSFAAKNPGRLRPEQVEKVRALIANLSVEITRLREEESELAARIALAREARVIAEEGLYEGVEVFCGHLRYVVTRDSGAAQVILADEALELAAL
ncbi:MAG: FapA family protein [Zoogloeaceae bacterium]|jgi:uncharacterized protein (DUF342 family)|nr:FapA family protein [Zoogloeaceae bacterium]